MPLFTELPRRGVLGNSPLAHSRNARKGRIEPHQRTGAGVFLSPFPLGPLSRSCSRVTGKKKKEGGPPSRRGPARVRVRSGSAGRIAALLGYYGQ